VKDTNNSTLLQSELKNSDSSDNNFIINNNAVIKIYNNDVNSEEYFSNYIQQDHFAEVYSNFSEFFSNFKDIRTVNNYVENNNYETNSSLRRDIIGSETTKINNELPLCSRINDEESGSAFKCNEVSCDNNTNSEYEKDNKLDYIDNPSIQININEIEGKYNHFLSNNYNEFEDNIIVNDVVYQSNSNINKNFSLNNENINMNNDSKECIIDTKNIAEDIREYHSNVCKSSKIEYIDKEQYKSVYAISPSKFITINNKKDQDNSDKETINPQVEQINLNNPFVNLSNSKVIILNEDNLNDEYSSDNVKKEINTCINETEYNSQIRLSKEKIEVCCRYASQNLEYDNDSNLISSRNFIDDDIKEEFTTNSLNMKKEKLSDLPGETLRNSDSSQQLKGNTFESYYSNNLQMEKKINNSLFNSNLRDISNTVVPKVPEEKLEKCSVINTENNECLKSSIIEKFSSCNNNSNFNQISICNDYPTNDYQENDNILLTNNIVQSKSIITYSYNDHQSNRELEIEDQLRLDKHFETNNIHKEMDQSNVLEEFTSNSNNLHNNIFLEKISNYLKDNSSSNNPANHYQNKQLQTFHTIYESNYSSKATKALNNLEKYQSEKFYNSSNSLIKITINYDEFKDKESLDFCSNKASHNHTKFIKKESDFHSNYCNVNQGKYNIFPNSNFNSGNVVKKKEFPLEKIEHYSNSLLTNRN